MEIGPFAGYWNTVHFCNIPLLFKIPLKKSSNEEGGVGEGGTEDGLAGAVAVASPFSYVLSATETF